MATPNGTRSSNAPDMESNEGAQTPYPFVGKRAFVSDATGILVSGTNRSFPSEVDQQLALGSRDYTKTGYLTDANIYMAFYPKTRFTDPYFSMFELDFDNFESLCTKDQVWGFQLRPEIANRWMAAERFLLTLAQALLRFHPLLPEFPCIDPPIAPSSYKYMGSYSYIRLVHQSVTKAYRAFRGLFALVSFLAALWSGPNQELMWQPLLDVLQYEQNHDVPIALVQSLMSSPLLSLSVDARPGGFLDARKTRWFSALKFICRFAPVYLYFGRGSTAYPGHYIDPRVLAYFPSASNAPWSEGCTIKPGPPDPPQDSDRVSNSSWLYECERFISEGAQSAALQLHRDAPEATFGSPPPGPHGPGQAPGESFTTFHKRMSIENARKYESADAQEKERCDERVKRDSWGSSLVYEWRGDHDLPEYFVRTFVHETERSELSDKYWNIRGVFLHFFNTWDLSPSLLKDAAREAGGGGDDDNDDNDDDDDYDDDDDMDDPPCRRRRPWAWIPAFGKIFSSKESHAILEEVDRPLDPFPGLVFLGPALEWGDEAATLSPKITPFSPLALDIYLLDRHGYNVFQLGVTGGAVANAGEAQTAEERAAVAEEVDNLCLTQLMYGAGYMKKPQSFSGIIDFCETLAHQASLGSPSLDLNLAWDVSENATPALRPSLTKTGLTLSIVNTTTQQCRTFFGGADAQQEGDGRLYILGGKSCTGSSHRRGLLLATADPTTVLFLCRHRVGDLFEAVSLLVRFLIPFRVVLKFPRGQAVGRRGPRLPDHLRPFLMPKGFKPTKRDYENYQGRCKEVLDSVWGPTVLSLGGITGRLAHWVVNSIRLLDGPQICDEVIGWTENCEYVADRVPKEVLEATSGSYLVRERESTRTQADAIRFGDSQESPPNKVSWWPNQDIWRNGGLYSDLWSSRAEAWYLESLKRAGMGDSKPLGDAEWEERLGAGEENPLPMLEASRRLAAAHIDSRWDVQSS